MPPPSTMCRRLLPVMGVLALAGCTQGGLDPRGDEASRIYDVTVWLTIAGGAVALLVIVIFVVAVRSRGSAGEHRDESEQDTLLERRFVIAGGIVLPAVILIGFFGVQIWSTMEQKQEGAFTIEAVGHRFWWEATYRDLPGGTGDFTTANQFHIPVDTDVTVALTTDDVIHSFWVPQLAGKLDMTPGRVNRFTFRADAPGTYEGYCAEYCGLQHAWMKFEVVAMEQAAFGEWASQMAEPAPEPEGDTVQRGKEVFLENSCVGCHTIKGVAEEGVVGPDLTHLASRNEIGAGIVPLDTGNLTAWVVNAQAIKPGVQMPPQSLAAEDLDALIAYLMSLE